MAKPHKTVVLTGARVQIPLSHSAEPSPPSPDQEGKKQLGRAAYTQRQRSDPPFLIQ